MPKCQIISPKYFLNERLDLLCGHTNSDLFTCKDIMFSRESSPGISLVFISKQVFSAIDAVWSWWSCICHKYKYTFEEN